MRVVFGWLVLGVLSCSSNAGVRAELEVVSVDPRSAPPEISEVAVLFRTTRAGALRVEATDLPDGVDPVVARLEDVNAGGLATVRVPRADFAVGPHLVTLVLAPADGSPPFEAEAWFIVEQDDEPGDGDADADADADADGDGDADALCEESCAGEAQLLVCGMDGRTYDNACLMACAGTTSQYEGACQEVPVDCVDLCLDEGFSPVCGEDDQTYVNACQLECEGVEEAHPGFCIDF